MNVRFIHEIREVASPENLLEAWSEFVKGKRGKADVQEFSMHLMDNILSLSDKIVNSNYEHGGYKAFNISDPKPRNIHKASVADRLVHHAIHRKLYPFFDKVFTADSFSCRVGKGTHVALRRFRFFTNKASKNNTRTCWVLKCDIRKFFASIDHKILLGALKKHITDEKLIGLLKEIIQSFHSTTAGVGLPLGNLTSQLFVNIYMNEFDQFVKHELRVKYYVRYADDFVFLSDNRAWLLGLVPQIREFLAERLKLELHPKKLYLKTLASGLDFLGWVHFLDHRVLRTTTKKRMLKRLAENSGENTRASYLGMLKHGNARKLEARITSFIT